MSVNLEVHAESQFHDAGCVNLITVVHTEIPFRSQTQTWVADGPERGSGRAASE